MQKQWKVAVAVSGLLLHTCAAAFGLEEFVMGNAWHQDITVAALTPPDPATGKPYFHPSAIQAIGWNNAMLDDLGNVNDRLPQPSLKKHLLQKNFHQAHFDNLNQTDKLLAQYERHMLGAYYGIQYLAERARGNPSQRDIALWGAYNVLGTLTHAIQDIYSHSSWVNDPARRDKTLIEFSKSEILNLKDAEDPWIPFSRQAALWTGLYDSDNNNLKAALRSSPDGLTPRAHGSAFPVIPGDVLSEVLNEASRSMGGKLTNFAESLGPVDIFGLGKSAAAWADGKMRQAVDEVKADLSDSERIDGINLDRIGMLPYGFLMRKTPEIDAFKADYEALRSYPHLQRLMRESHAVAALAATDREDLLKLDAFGFRPSELIPLTTGEYAMKVDNGMKLFSHAADLAARHSRQAIQAIEKAIEQQRDPILTAFWTDVRNFGLKDKDAYQVSVGPDGWGNHLDKNFFLSDNRYANDAPYGMVVGGGYASESASATKGWHFRVRLVTSEIDEDFFSSRVPKRLIFRVRLACSDPRFKERWFETMLNGERDQVFPVDLGNQVFDIGGSTFYPHNSCRPDMIGFRKDGDWSWKFQNINVWGYRIDSTKEPAYVVANFEGPLALQDESAQAHLIGISQVQGIASLQMYGWPSDQKVTIVCEEALPVTKWVKSPFKKSARQADVGKMLARAAFLDKLGQKFSAALDPAGAKGLPDAIGVRINLSAALSSAVQAEKLEVMRQFSLRLSPDERKQFVQSRWFGSFASSVNPIDARLEGGLAGQKKRLDTGGDRPDPSESAALLREGVDQMYEVTLRPAKPIDKDRLRQTNTKRLTLMHKNIRLLNPIFK